MTLMVAPKKKAADNPWPKKLSAFRAKAGLNQARAAALVHISQSQWSAFESGSRKPTRPVALLLDLLLAGKI